MQFIPVAIEHSLITWIHLLSASIWVGGSLFIGVVLAPTLKAMSMPVPERIKMMIVVGRRFNKIAAPALAALIITGVYTSRAFLTPEAAPLLLSSGYGQVLIIKILLVISLVIAYIVHVRMVRGDVEERLVSGDLDDSQIQSLRKRIMIIGEVTVVISVAVLFLAAMLDSGV